MTKKTNTEPAQTKSLAVQPIKPAEQPKIYIGPALPGLLQFTTLIGSLPEQLKKHEKSKALKALLVTPEELSAAITELNTKGSLKAHFYNKFLEEVKGQ